MNGQLEHLIDATLARVDTAMAQHHVGEAAPLSIALLQSISAEIRRVRAEWPLRTVGYGRFVVDWPDESELRSDLIEAAYQLERARQKDAKRKS